MSHTPNDRRNRERPVQASTIGRHQKARKARQNARQGRPSATPHAAQGFYPNGPSSSPACPRNLLYSRRSLGVFDIVGIGPTRSGLRVIRRYNWPVMMPARV
jgi:hypothetical protein